MSEECGSCEYNRQCFIKKNVGIFECEKEKIRVVRYEDYKKLENIIKEVREYIKQNEFYLDYKTGACIKGVIPLLEILDKENKGEYV